MLNFPFKEVTESTTKIGAEVKNIASSLGNFAGKFIASKLEDNGKKSKNSDFDFPEGWKLESLMRRPGIPSATYYARVFSETEVLTLESAGGSPEEVLEKAKSVILAHVLENKKP